MDRRPDRLTTLVVTDLDAGTPGPGTTAAGGPPGVRDRDGSGGPTLLSRVAERVYWAGRYLERAESTARIVKTHAELYLDLPRAAGLGWAPLLTITGSAEGFSRHYDDPTEEAVTAYLLVEEANEGSILSSLSRARENMRTARAVFPRTGFAVLNNLAMRCGTAVTAAGGRRGRAQLLEDVIGSCQQLNGLLEGTMSHDEVHAFLQLGRLLERADMTTRVLDVRAGSLLEGSPAAEHYADVAWMGVLRSLSGYQMYRRRVHHRVNGADVLTFLLRDPQFPRAIDHCLAQISRHLLELGRHDTAMASCAAAQQLIEQGVDEAPSGAALHRYVDRLQGRLDHVHDTVCETYFRRPSADARPLLASA